MSSQIIQLHDIRKIYHKSSPQETRALDGVSLEISQGEVFSLLGVNGAGKTTLSAILATVHPPTSGNVLFEGKSIYDDVWAYRKRVGFCPQQSNLDPYLTVYENLLFSGQYFMLSYGDAKNRADQLIEQYRLEQYTKYFVNQLSGGTRQRVLIARSLMHKPCILILDEPTVGLDPDIRRELWDQIKVLKNDGVTIILTTHYLDEAEYLSDRVCLLRSGKVQLIKKVSELKEEHNDTSLEEIFLTLTKQSREVE